MNNASAAEWGPPGSVADAVSRVRDEARRMIGMANQMLAAARELDAVADQMTFDGNYQPMTRLVPATLAKDSHDLLRAALDDYRNRRRRTTVFEDETIFGEPAWDILLDLFIAAKTQKQVSITSACIGAAVPPTTALRWLTVLENKGLIVREVDPADARRAFVRLSGTGYSAMVRYFTG